MKTIELKRTDVGKSYWNGDGAYQAELEKLNELMPAIGAADTLNGELVRATNRLYYEYFNNGNGNACEVRINEVETGYDDEDGNIEYDEEETREWNQYYKKFFDLILKTIESVKHQVMFWPFKKAMLKVEEMVVEFEPSHSDEEKNAYDTMVDYVVWYVLNHIDRPLPKGYDRK